MGGFCSNTNTIEPKFNSSNPKLVNENRLYKLRHAELNALGDEKINECLNKGNKTLEGMDTIYTEVFNTKKLTGKVKEEEIKIGIKELYVLQQICAEGDIILSYDIQNKVMEKLSKYNDILIKKYTQDGINNIFQKLFESYPKEQNGFLLSGNPVNMIGKGFEEAFYSNLKFNENFQVELLIFEIDDSQIKDINHLQKLAEVIACNIKLRTLSLILNDDISTDLNNLNPIFQAIQDHQSLNSLVIIAKSSKNKLKLNPIIESRLLNLFNENNTNLNSFILGRVIVSNEFIENLEKKISLIKNLKIFSIVFNEEDPLKNNSNLVNNLIFNGIGKSKSLLAVLIGGIKLTEKQEEDCKKLENDNNNCIKLFHSLENFEIEI